jgi:hypothetical protein
MLRDVAELSLVVEDLRERYSRRSERTFTKNARQRLQFSFNRSDDTHHASDTRRPRPRCWLPFRAPADRLQPRCAGPRYPARSSV